MELVTYALDVSAVLSNIFQRFISDFTAVCDIQSLQSVAVASNGMHRGVRNVLHPGDVERHQCPVTLDNLVHAEVRQFGAIGQSQALDSLAASKRHEGAITDLRAEGGQIETFDQVIVIEEGMGTANGLDDIMDSRPVASLWSMPKQSHAVPGPLTGDKHTGEVVTGVWQLLEDGNHDFGGQAADWGDYAALLDFVGLSITDLFRLRKAQGGDRVVALHRERFIVIVGGPFRRCGCGGGVGMDGRETTATAPGAILRHRHDDFAGYSETRREPNRKK